MSRARRFAGRAAMTTMRAVREFIDDRGHRDAAQIAFFAVLSAVPFAMLLVGGLGLAFDDREVREHVVRAIFDNVPLASESDRPRLERTLQDSLDNAGHLGPVSVLVLIAAASGVMGALRHSIDGAFDIEARPGLLKRKALDLSLVSLVALAAVFGGILTATRRAEAVFDDEGGGLPSAVLDAVGDMLPVVFTALVVLVLYRVLPWPRPRVRDVWPGAVVAAAGIAVARGVLELYFEHLTDLGALYGSLGAVMALIVFVYVASLVLVFGAEFAAEWPRTQDAGHARPPEDGAADLAT
jgi:membrane protein